MKMQQYGRKRNRAPMLLAACACVLLMLSGCGEEEIDSLRVLSSVKVEASKELFDSLRRDHDIFNSALSEKCRLIAREKLDRIKAVPPKMRTFLPSVEEMESAYQREIDPVAYFLNNPTNRQDYWIHTHALIWAQNQREYDVYRQIAQLMPTNVSTTTGIQQVPKERKEECLETADRFEQTFQVFSLNKGEKVRLFRRFPSLTNVQINPAQTHVAEWVERLSHAEELATGVEITVESYRSKREANELIVKEIASGQMALRVSNLESAEILWSPTGRYLAVEGFRMIWNDILKGRSVQELSEKEQRKLWCMEGQAYFLDLKYPGTVIKLTDELPALGLYVDKPELVRCTPYKWVSDNEVEISYGFENDGTRLNKELRVIFDEEVKPNQTKPSVRFEIKPEEKFEPWEEE